MRKKIEKRKSKNWGDMDKLDDSLNKMEVLTKHLNELVEELNSLIDAKYPFKILHITSIWRM